MATAGSIHTIIAAGTVLIYEFMFLGWVDFIIFNKFAFSQHKAIYSIHNKIYLT